MLSDDKIGPEQPLDQRVYRYILWQLLNGKIFPGMRLNEQEYSDLCKVSRSPVRSAIKQLAQEGLVDTQVSKGAMIRRLSINEAEAVFSFRAELAKLAAEWCVRNITDIDILELSTLIEEEKQYADKEDLVNILKVSRAFHLKIADVANNSWLKKSLSELLIHSSILHLYYGPTMKYPARSPMEHQALLELLSAREGEQAGELAREQVLDLGRRYIKTKY
ncbi:GntR family transcriptional regulator [Allopusillimonas ginsengisoli]|uniref:GntR family transcriptional regulator n=1 Tax=Allopusillimonas ginsengisoli TaxID=453575 RepID=UPI0010224476|nr:GntR family transcriptional regulator [Allopusillimonas ginsengisoli]TEA79655.1 GntR family transcriptional regulator [Allopusillimonas ginsengisoli]